MNEVFAFLHGKPYVLDGVSGLFRHEQTTDRHRLTVERLIHEPDETGRQSEVYRAKRREMKDDWVTDLTGCIEWYCDIAYELGYVHRRDLCSDGLPKCLVCYLDSKGTLTLQVTYPEDRQPEPLLQALEAIGWQRSPRQVPGVGPYKMAKMFFTRPGSLLFGAWSEDEQWTFRRLTKVVLSAFGWSYVPSRAVEAEL